MERKYIWGGNRLWERGRVTWILGMWTGVQVKTGQGREITWGYCLWDWLAKDLLVVFVWIMELWVQVLLICSQSACILSVIALGLYVQANRGCSLEGAHWVGFWWTRECTAIIQCPKRHWFIIVILCSLYMFWVVRMDGSLDYCTTMWLEWYCQQLHKWDKIHYGKAFISLHSRVSPETEVCLLVQRREGTLEPLPNSQTREEKNEEINLINALNPRDTMFIAGGPPPSHPHCKLLLK